MLAILLIQSCGPSGEGPPALPSGATPKVQQVQTKLSEEIDKYQLSCEGSNCNLVGMLVSQQGKMRWRCSSFFINENVMATAAHCLPAQLKTPGSKCKNDIYVLLANQSAPLHCREVLDVKQLSFGEFDYAFIKVERPHKRPLPVSIQRQGRYNKQRVKIIKVDPVKDDVYAGKIKETQCELNNNSMISLYFNGPRTPQIQYSGCQTVSGNSGAPILNTNNKIIGIHHSSIKPNSPLSQALAAKTTKGYVDEFGSATNFGCLCPVKGSYRRCLYYKSCRGQMNHDHLMSARQKSLDRLTYGHNKVQGLRPLKTAHGFTYSKKYFNWTSQILFKQKKDKKGHLKQLKMYLTYRPSCLKNEWKFNDLPLKEDALHYNNIPFCEIDYKLSSSLRLESISSSQNTSCQKVKAIFELENPNKLIITSQYGNNIHPFMMSRSIPYCD